MGDARAPPKPILRRPVVPMRVRHARGSPRGRGKVACKRRGVAYNSPESEPHRSRLTFSARSSGHPRQLVAVASRAGALALSMWPLPTGVEYARLGTRSGLINAGSPPPHARFFRRKLLRHRVRGLPTRAEMDSALFSRRVASPQWLGILRNRSFVRQPAGRRPPTGDRRAAWPCHDAAPGRPAGRARDTLGVQSGHHPGPSYPSTRPNKTPTVAPARRSLCDFGHELHSFAVPQLRISAAPQLRSPTAPERLHSLTAPPSASASPVGPSTRGPARTNSALRQLSAPLRTAPGPRRTLGEQPSSAQQP
jgi:hypothetical protein